MLHRSPTRTLIAIWFAWVVILLGYQAAVSARYTIQKPDVVLSWTAGSTLGKPQPDRPYLIEPFLNAQVAWDSEFYLSIATRGYDDPTSRTIAPQPDAKPPFNRRLSLNYAFFPVYPFLMRVVAVPLGLLGLNPIAAATLAGILISITGTLAGMLALADLVRRTSDDDGIRAAFYLLTFPTSFFLAQVYTEGLFIGLAFSCLALSRRKAWFWAGTLAAIATLTRAVGVVLILPLALTWLKTFKPLWLGPFHWRTVLAGLKEHSAGLLIAAPLLTYLIWKQSFWGGAFPIVQRAFFSCEPLALSRAWSIWRQAFLSLFGSNSQTMVYYAIELSIILLAIYSCFVTCKRYPDVALFGLVVIGLSITCGLAQSTSRYILTVPSVFILLNRWGRNVVFDRAWTIASILLMGMLSALFTSDMWAG